MEDMVKFLKFSDYVSSRTNLDENRKANEFATALAQFQGRFGKNGEAIVKANGYASVAAFLQDKDHEKWAKLRIPGQDNYDD